MEEEILELVGEVLQLGDRLRHMTPETPLLGGLPEMDSLAVVNIVTALEERYDLILDEDELSAQTFETVASLSAFVEQQLKREA